MNELKLVLTVFAAAALLATTTPIAIGSDDRDPYDSQQIAPAPSTDAFMRGFSAGLRVSAGIHPAQRNEAWEKGAESGQSDSVDRRTAALREWDEDEDLSFTHAVVAAAAKREVTAKKAPAARRQVAAAEPNAKGRADGIACLANAGQ